jgi:hypothetical protein
MPFEYAIAVLQPNSPDWRVALLPETFSSVLTRSDDARPRDLWFGALCPRGNDEGRERTCFREQEQLGEPTKFAPP